MSHGAAPVYIAIGCLTWLLCGCGGDLDSIVNPRVTLLFNQLSDGNPQVKITVRAAPTGAPSCPSVPGVSAMVGGVSIPQTESGGQPFGSVLCTPVTFEGGGLTDLTADGVPMVLRGGSTTFEMNVEKPCSPRSLQLVSPADGIVHVGDRVVLKWSEPTITLPDLLDSANYADVFVSSDVIEISGDELSFVAPATTVRGPAKINFASPQLMPLVDPCHGPAVCEAFCDGEIVNGSIDITIQ